MHYIILIDLCRFHIFFVNKNKYLIFLDKEDLENEIVTTKGEIHDRSQKIFTNEVISNRKNFNKDKKLHNNIKESNKRKTELKIRSDVPIFDNSMIFKHSNPSPSTTLIPTQPPFPSPSTSTASSRTQSPFFNSTPSSEFFTRNSSSSQTNNANTMQRTPVLPDSLTSSDDDESELQKSSSPIDQKQLLKYPMIKKRKISTTHSALNNDHIESPSSKLCNVKVSGNKENINNDMDVTEENDSTDDGNSSGDDSSGDDGAILSRMEIGTGKDKNY